jgi:putative SOS response-associated peptidase YedK
MCGRFANEINDPGSWGELLAEWPQGVEVGYNVAPTQTIPAFRSHQGEGMRWSLVPHWSKEPSSKFATFNARIEGIDGKPAFRDPWRRNQRCLIPALGYYEWRKESGGKQPYFVRREDGEPMLFGGLWEVWGEERILSCTIITRQAEPELAALHPRMPLMIAPQEGEHWLSAPVSTLGEILARPFADQLRIDRVGRAVNRVGNSGAGLIAPEGLL